MLRVALSVMAIGELAHVLGHGGHASTPPGAFQPSLVFNNDLTNIESCDSRG